MGEVKSANNFKVKNLNAYRENLLIVMQLVFAAILVFCSFSAWAAEDPCNPTPPEPPDPNPSDCMPIELGE